MFTAQPAIKAAGTTIVVLGVDHSAQLVAESCQPAVYRAFFDRVAPNAICIERPPEQFACNDHYEFTYEVQHLAVPYARERRIALCPFDWIPPAGDQQLGFGLDIETPPLVRNPRGFQGFLSFADAASLDRPFFFADAEEARAAVRPWYTNPAQHAAADLPRRLFLYRTFMQAQRIVRAAEAFSEGVVLVLVGHYHKDDIEQILAGDHRFKVVQPSGYGLPVGEEVEQQVYLEDMYAIASFNVLGVQSRTETVNWSWIHRVVERLKAAAPSFETELLSIRLSVLSGRLPPEAAIRAYGAVRSQCPVVECFTWTGVKDADRIDSYFDPFGNLSVAQRAALELAREYYKCALEQEARGLQQELYGALSGQQQHQLMAYWPEYVRGMR